MESLPTLASDKCRSNTGLAVVIILAALAELAQGQEARPAYEAATIKLNASGSGNRGLQEDKAQVVFTSIPLKRLIQWAYKVYPFQMSGPGWLEDVYFDIFAKYPPDMKDEERPFMLRTLLEDRLKLVVHHETREMQGYALVIAKGGFKLKAVEPDPPVISSLGAVSPGLDLRGGFRRSVLIAKRSSMASLADLVSRLWDQMVIDRTGLTGVYDFELRWNNDNLNPAPPDGDSFPFLFTALQETLGLRLQAEKVPVEVIVVGHVERVPIEN
jgi:uncharacterized protein (TIGR03435 family)